MTTTDAWTVELTSATGSPGNIRRWDGKQFSVAATFPGKALWGIWGSSARDIWVVGGNLDSGKDGLVVHYNGDRWSGNVLSPEQTAEEYLAVHGASAESVWAVGLSGGVLQCAASTEKCTTMTAPEVKGLSRGGTDPSQHAAILRLKR